MKDLEKLCRENQINISDNMNRKDLVKKILNEDSAPLLFMSAGFLQRRKGFDLLIKSINIIKSKYK